MTIIMWEIRGNHPSNDEKQQKIEIKIDNGGIENKIETKNYGNIGNKKIALKENDGKEEQQSQKDKQNGNSITN